MIRFLCRVLLQVLFVPCVGLMWAICVAQACYLVIVDAAYRKNLYALVFAKLEH